MIQLTCPNCGAIMGIEASREFAFCSFCGTKMITKSQIEINRKEEINNLLSRAYEYEERKDYAKAKDYCNRILDIDANNEYARDLEKRLLALDPINNICVTYKSCLNDKFKLMITTDGKNWITIEPNTQFSFKLPLGDHRILFSGRKNYTRIITVTDVTKNIEITYEALGRKNEIYIK